MRTIAELPSQQFPPTCQTYTERDTMLYALGLGIGQDPVDPTHLKFVYEKDLKVLPTLGAVLATPASWMWRPDSGIDWKQMVALSHDFEVFQEMPSSGSVTSQVRVTDVFDRGPDRGAIVHWERDLNNTSSGALLCRTRARALARANGGFGGAPAPHQMRTEPAGGPYIFDWAWHTQPAQALLYRLSGDMNPLHGDPDVAGAAGFERPILHGLGMLGMAAFALIKLCCNGDPQGLRRITARYASVFYPGETLQTQIWIDDKRVCFRCRSREREVVVLECGEATLDV